jgi:hypothetical protein
VIQVLKVLSSIDITNPGQYYELNDTITIVQVLDNSSGTTTLSPAIANITSLTKGKVTSIGSISSPIGSGFAVGDEVSFIGPVDDMNNRAPFISEATARVETISVTGGITGLTLTYSGFGYTAKPTTLLAVTGTTNIPSNAVNITTEGVGGIGSIEITDSGYDNTTNGVTVTGSTSGSGCILAAVDDPLFSPPGYYAGEDGFISSFLKRIHDGRRWQKYSYVVKSSEPMSKWESPLRYAVHPAGFEVFNDISITTMIPVMKATPIVLLTDAGLLPTTTFNVDGCLNYRFITDNITYYRAYGSITESASESASERDAVDGNGNDYGSVNDTVSCV